MRPIARQLLDLSYSRRGLAQSCAFILLMGLAIAGITGMLFNFLHPSVPPPPPDRIERIHLDFLNTLLPEEHREELVKSRQNNIPVPHVENFFNGPETEWLPSLKLRTGKPEPEPGVCFALGLYEVHEGDPQQALDLFHRENEVNPHPLVRQYEIEATLRTRNREHLNTLRENPEYADVLGPSVFFHMGMLTQNWHMILRWFLQAEYQGVPASVLLLALIAGAVWTALLLSLFPLPLRKVYWGLVPLALGLGWISTWPTVWSGIWLDSTFHLTEGDDFVSALIYLLVSVGLREELCKILLFTPLLFRVVKNGRDLEALVLGALVGLGFAIEENITYFTDYQGSGVVVSRYVSANLLHLTLTGANALALTRAVRDPGRWTADAVTVFAMTIGLHGIYNALLTQPVPGFGDMSYFSGAALAGCSYLFFREIQRLSGGHGLRVSRTALFCWGFCLLFNLELLNASMWLPFDKALYLVGNAALSAVFIGYIFIHEIQEPLGP